MTNVALRGGVAEVKLAEMQVNSVNLRFKDPKTGEAREEGSTRPDIILRHLCTKPGQVNVEPLQLQHEHDGGASGFQIWLWQ